MEGLGTRFYVDFEQPQETKLPATGLRLQSDATLVAPDLTTSDLFDATIARNEIE